MQRRLVDDRPLDESLRRLVSLADRLEIVAPRKEPRRSSRRLPAKFRRLMPLIERYAVSDDVERTEMVAGMSAADRQALIDAVGPLMGDIDVYLMSRTHEESTRLGDLAQLVAELRLDQGENVDSQRET